MSNINIITSKDNRLYPAKVYETEETEFIRPLMDIDNILDTLNRRQHLYIISNQYNQYGEEIEAFNGELKKEDIKSLYAEKDDGAYKDLSYVISLSEAAQKWGLVDGSTIRKAIERGKFDKYEVKRAGDIWITTYAAMERVFGPVKNEENDFIIYTDFEVFLRKKLAKDAYVKYCNKIIKTIDKNQGSSSLAIEKDYEDKFNKRNEANDYIKEVFVRALKSLKNNNRVIIMKRGTDKDKVDRIIKNEKELFYYLQSFLIKRIMTPEQEEELEKVLRSVVS